MILPSARINGVLNRFSIRQRSTSKDHVLLMRKAAMNTIQVPEFLAHAQKSKLDLAPICGEEIHRQV